jgi:hypothetical protein
MEERTVVLPQAEPGKQVTHENPVYSELLLQEEHIREMTPADQSDVLSSYVGATGAEEEVSHTH